MISFLINAIKIIFLLGFLIFIHESGHFLIAKLCKVKVKEFAIGFGPTVWRKQGKQTKYAIRLIPLGGFVNMLGEEERSEEEGSFSKTKIPKRIAIVLAGGLVNIAFGLIVYFILMASSGNYISNIVEEPIKDYPAIEAGILKDDKILKIDNKKIRLKSDIDKIINGSNGKEVCVTIKRDNNIEKIYLKPFKQITKSIGIYLGVESDNISTQIKSIYVGSPAEQVGLQQGDFIIKIDNKDVNNDPYIVVEMINNSENEEINIEIERNGELKNFSIKPEIINTYKLGVTFKIAENTFTNNIYYAFWDTVDFSISIIDNLKELFTGKVSTEQLMGPVGISSVVSKTKGLTEFIYILALISLSLGITNLLPFPPLDGGKILFLLIEGIRKKPIKENVETGIQMIGFVILIGMSIYVTYNDIIRIF